jgi:protein phosphatase 2C family protein 2/3
MGQVLSEPITAKEISVCQSSEYSVAACSMQGWRVSMEDSHVHLLGAPQDENAAFFGVFDGHGVCILYS